MILFTILCLVLTFLMIFMVVTVSAIGAGGIVIFGDVIVCIAVIVLIIRAIIRRRDEP